MLTCDTMDTAASRAADAGSRRGRLPDRAHHRADGEGRGEPAAHRRANLRERGCDVPIVADIHFKPDAAMEAAKWVEKVRINPGNYADSKKFAIKEYTDEQYAAELERIEEQFTPLVKLCKELGRAMRIGTNHGSLSDRIMNRFGDTPLGMVESALEFARIAREHDYHNFMFSMKSSNPKVMIECYRLLVARLDAARAGLELPDSPRRHRSRRRRGRPHQERDRHRLAALRRTRRHDPRFADGRFAARNRSLPAICWRRFRCARPTYRRVRIPDDRAFLRSVSLRAPRDAEIELDDDDVKCGGEQTVRVVVTRRPGTRSRRRFDRRRR